MYENRVQASLKLRTLILLLLYGQSNFRDHLAVFRGHINVQHLMKYIYISLWICANQHFTYLSQRVETLYSSGFFWDVYLEFNSRCTTRFTVAMIRHFGSIITVSCHYFNQLNFRKENGQFALYEKFQSSRVNNKKLQLSFLFNETSIFENLSLFAVCLQWVETVTSRVCWGAD